MKKTNKKIVVVYGTGASHSSGYKVKFDNYVDKSPGPLSSELKPPMDNNFFKTNEMIDLLRIQFKALHKYLELYYPSFPQEKDLSLEQVWSSLDLNNKHITLGTYDWLKETSDYINFSIDSRYIDMDKQVGPKNFYELGIYNKYKFLGDCGRDLRRLISNLYANYAPPDRQKNCFMQLHEKIIEKSDEVAYITFNYDCYLEDALTDIDEDFKYIDVSVDTNSIDDIKYGFIPIIKLHGSLNWKEFTDYDQYGITFLGAKYNKEHQVRAEYNHDKRWLQPAIVAPTAFKQEINDDQKTQDRKTQLLMAQWKSAVTLLNEATHLLIVGYSFPSTDFHSNRLFQISSMVKKTNGKHKILYCSRLKTEDSWKKIKFMINSQDDLTNIDGNRGFENLCDSKELRSFLDS